MIEGLLYEYAAMIRREAWGRERIEESQDRRLRETIRHAYERVPFYREGFDRARVEPDQIRTLGDLKRVPVVGKMDIRKRSPHELVARGTERHRCRVISTGGSTGIPLRIFLSQWEFGRRKAPWVKFYFEQGLRPWHRRVSLEFGSTRDSPLWYNRLGIMPWRSLREDLYQKEAIRVVRQYRPDVFSGLPSLLHLFALQARDEGAHDLRPRLIHCSGETLTPQTRRLLETTFQAPVLDTYGANEFGFIAGPCPTGSGYHLATDHLVLECLKDGQPVAQGEAGEVVITGLLGRTMPFIRYHLGDVAVLGRPNCPCGNPRTRIEHIEGRLDDFIPLSDGRVLGPREARLPLSSLNQVLQYRIIQEGLDRFRIQLVLEAPLGQEQMERVRQLYEERFLAREVEFEVLSEIPRDEPGKIRQVISRVPWEGQ